AGTHKQVENGVLLSDLYPHPEKPIPPDQRGGSAMFGSIVSFPVQGAAFQYMRDHGVRSFDREIERLLKELLSQE
ncbi:MAG: hypothetical protein ACRD3S_12170, partial [Terracidiphilus sp.]